MRTTLFRQSLKRGVFTSAATTIVLLTLSDNLAAQFINNQLVLPPRVEPPPTETVMVTTDDGRHLKGFRVDPSGFFRDTYITAGLLARAAVVGDNTRLSDFSQDTFLPSAIPVPGQPFFGADDRASLQVSGNALRISVVGPQTADLTADAHAQIIVRNANFSGVDSNNDADVQLRQAFARLNRLQIGVMESAFADPAAVPEILDLAGPNARITAYDAGVGNGQGRLSYDIVSSGLPSGFNVITSIEQAIPEIDLPAADDATFAHYPDLICAASYVNDEVCQEVVNGKTVDKFVEYWHVQSSSVVRDLAFESPNATDQEAFGWGTSLSGAYCFQLSPCMESLDRVMGSFTYGEGIAHYVTDLNSEGISDAVVNAGGTLEALPLFAWYVAYMHNWTDSLRSTATYSEVDLDSTLPQGATDSPYHEGDYFGVNLIYHTDFVQDDDPDVAHIFYVGVEYLLGHKELLDGVDGDAQRILFVMAISD